MFDDFRTKTDKRENQNLKDGVVVKRKRGRSRKPNNENLHLMMDAQIKARFSDYVVRNRKGSMSRVVEDLVLELLKRDTP